MVRELDALIASRGRPAIVSDNGTELTCMAILRWSQETRVEWHYIAPGNRGLQSRGCRGWRRPGPPV